LKSDEVSRRSFSWTLLYKKQLKEKLSPIELSKVKYHFFRAVKRRPEVSVVQLHDSFWHSRK